MRSTHFLSRAYIYLIFLSTVPRFLTAEKEICLIEPFITSLKRAVLTPISENYKLTLYFTVDYNLHVKIDDVIIRSNNLIDSAGSKTFLESQKYELIYTQDDYKKENSNKTFALTKDHYIKKIKEIYKDELVNNKRINAVDLAKRCSNAFIPQADFIYPIGKDTFHRIVYHPYLMCAYEVSFSGDNYSEEFISSMNIPASSTVGATYTEPFLFEATGDSNINVIKFKKDNFPSKAKPFGGDFDLIFSGPMAALPAIWEPRKSFLSESACANLFSDDLVPYDFDIGQDHNWTKPFKYMGIYKNKSTTFFGQASERVNPYKDQFLMFDSEDVAPIMKFPLKPVIEDIEEWWWDSADSAGADENDPGHIMLVNMKNFSVLSVLGKVNQVFTKLDWALPDDSSYWYKCKRVVQVFGFLYLMHQYNSSTMPNIHTDRSELKMLDPSQFDHPIEAFHIYDNEFWFLTKASTIQVMIADDRNCDTLSFKPGQVSQLREKLGPKVKNYIIEGRYFDVEASEWNPPWPQDPREGVSVTKWVFIGVVLAIILLLISICAVAYSRARSSAETVRVYDANVAANPVIVSDSVASTKRSPLSPRKGSKIMKSTSGGKARMSNDRSKPTSRALKSAASASPTRISNLLAFSNKPRSVDTSAVRTPRTPLPQKAPKAKLKRKGHKPKAKVPLRN